MMQLTESTLQFGARPVFRVVGWGALETVVCRCTHSAIWRAGIACCLRGMGIALWTGFTTFPFKEVPLHFELICVKTNRIRTMLRACIFLYFVRQSWLSSPLLQRVHLSGPSSVHSRHVRWQRWHCLSLLYFPGSQLITHFPLSKSLPKNKTEICPHTVHLLLSHWGFIWLVMWWFVHTSPGGSTADAVFTLGSSALWAGWGTQFTFIRFA